MGLTTIDRPSDDCTMIEVDCKAHSGFPHPEVADELLDAVVAYVRTLPAMRAPAAAMQGAEGSELFATLGCADCHRPQLPIESLGADGAQVLGVISPYTDLRTHDLGARMADETVTGTKVHSLWRTAPLWGLDIRLHAARHATFLHDGRARSIEEAVLWHSGEAAHAERKFESLGPRERQILIGWVSSL